MKVTAERACTFGLSRLCQQAPWRVQIASAVIALIALSACADSKLPPLPTPGPDMCISYSAFRYSPGAAAVEAIDAIRAHNANEAIYHERCLLSPNRSTQGGSR